MLQSHPILALQLTACVGHAVGLSSDRGGGVGLDDLNPMPHTVLTLCRKRADIQNKRCPFHATVVDVSNCRWLRKRKSAVSTF